MTHLQGKSIALMPQNSPVYVAAVLLEVCKNTSNLSDLTNVFSVWGFIWLIVAIIFFALGVIVGIAAFKVRSFLFEMHIQS